VSIKYIELQAFFLEKNNAAVMGFYEPSLQQLRQQAAMQAIPPLLHQ
jgi:hypothetical protein